MEKSLHSVCHNKITYSKNVSNIPQPDTLFRDYTLIGDRNSQTLLESREVPFLHYLQSPPSLSLFSSAALLKQVVPDGAKKVLCIRLCWHLLEWKIIKEWIFKQVVPRSRHSSRQRQDLKKQRSTCSTTEEVNGCYLIPERELKWMVMQDHRQERL